MLLLTVYPFPVGFPKTLHLFQRMKDTFNILKMIFHHCIEQDFHSLDPILIKVYYISANARISTLERSSWRNISLLRMMEKIEGSINNIIIFC